MNDFFSSLPIPDTTLGPVEPRCMGEGCKDRERCLRYLQRDSGKRQPAKTYNHHNEPECFYLFKSR